MSNKGNYIKRIQIDALWSRRRGIDWTLRPDVNILSGVNGVGKSTILNRVVRQLIGIDRLEKQMDGVTLTFSPEDADTVDFDVIRSFDRPLVSSDLLGKVADSHLQSELDLQLYQLQRNYLDYQVNMSNRMVAIFTSQVPDAQKLASEVQDLRDAAAYLPHRVTVRAGDFADLGECDVIVNSVGKIELLETHDRLTEMDFHHSRRAELCPQDQGERL